MSLRIASLLAVALCAVNSPMLVAQTKTVTHTFTVDPLVSCNCVLAVTTVGVTNATACDKSDGNILVSVTGGSGTYNYSWVDASNTLLSTGADLWNAAPGYYFLTVTDAFNPGCRGQQSFEVGSDLSILNTITSNTNCTTPNGAINVSAVGGSGLYTYRWQFPDGSFANQRNINGLKGGQYSLTVTDTQKGCSITRSFTVKNLVNLSVATLNQVGNSSCQTPNGRLELSVTGGSGNTKFYWYDLATAAYVSYQKDLIDTKAGQYSFYAVDQISGCTAYQFHDIPDLTQKPAFTYEATPNQNCSAPFDGSIELTPGGTPGPWLYEWSNGGTVVSTEEDPSGLAPGTYGVTITDQLTGCKTVRKATDPEAIMIEDLSTPSGTVQLVSSTGSSDCSTPNGSLQVAPLDASYPITYSWTGPNNFSSTSASITGLTPGTYVLTTTAPCTLNQPPAIVQTLVRTSVNEPVLVDLLELITDPDQNLDPASIRVVDPPSSGAGYDLSQEAVLTLDYNGRAFKGRDNLRIRACDLLNACTEETLSIDVDQTGDVIVFNAVAPRSTGDNQFLRIMNLPDASNHVVIYNRWGDPVFEVMDYDNNDQAHRFEGYSRTGQLLPSGTYFYKIEIEGASSYTGYLALKL